MMTDTERVVAVGLLTARDLEVLGEGFQRMFPVEETDTFADLIGKLEAVDWPPSDATPAKR